MKILYITMVKFQRQSGGRTRSMRIRELLGENHDVFQVNINPTNTEPFPEEIQGGDFSVSVPWFPDAFHFSMIGNELLSALRTPFACSDFDPDIVYTYNSWHHLPLAGWLSSRYHNVPLIVGVNDHRSTDGLIKGLAHGWLRNKILLEADAVVLESNTLLSNIPDRIPSENIVEVPTGIDFSEYKRTGADHFDTPTVFYVGRSGDIDLLIDSLSILEERVPGVRVRLAGVDSDEFPDVESESIDFLGYVSDEQLKSELAKSYVCVIPYTDEKTAGRPIKLIEYMAAGKCIVATDNPYNTQLLTDGKNAIVTDTTPEAFASGIIEGITNPELREDLAVQARKDISELSLESMRENLEEVLRVAKG